MTEAIAISTETRLPRAEFPRVDTALSAIARHQSFAKRSLIAQRNRGEKISKPQALLRFGLTGRQYNAIKREVDGLFQSQATNMARYVSEAEQRIELANRRKKGAKTEIALLQSEGVATDSACYDKWYATLRGSERRIQKLTAAKARWQSLLDAKRIKYCEGTRRLFHRQFHPKDNGYRNHQAWLTEYRSARDCEFFALGSKDETMGNQSCVISTEDGQNYALQVRVPTGLESQLGTHITLNNIRFPYRQADIERAVTENQFRQHEGQKKRWQGEKYQTQHLERIETLRKEQGEAVDRWQAQGLNEKALVKRQDQQARYLAKVSKPTQNNLLAELGQAISYRFVRDRKGWRIIVSITREAEPSYITNPVQGAIGIDLNEHHLAVTEIDGRGNKVQAYDAVFRPTGYDATSRQVRTWLEEAVKAVVRRAAETGKPIAIERLDFKQKKAALPTTGQATFNRTVSSLMTARFKSVLKLRCFEAGVELISVTAAYTSLIGRLKYARECNGSVHQGAARVIARRGIGLSDRHLPARYLTTVRGRPAAFVTPEDVTKDDPWAYWQKVSAAYRQWLQSTWQAARVGYSTIATPAACAELTF